MTTIPVGKLPSAFLAQLLAEAPKAADVVLGPAPGVDCAVVRIGEHLLALKADPITLAADSQGWYLVQVNANDLATVGAVPRWMLVTLLLPEREATEAFVMNLMAEIYAACAELDIVVVGGHSEVTNGLARPLAIGAMVGEVPEGKLVIPRGAQPGDTLLLTKGVPLEGTAILARDFREQLEGVLTGPELDEAAHYLFEPGISILRDAQVAQAAGTVHAMHDPTEGGLATALWELAEASRRTLIIEPEAIPRFAVAERMCAFLKLDPLGVIASGALLLAVPAGENARRICTELGHAGIPCAQIGTVVEGEPAVLQESGDGQALLPRPQRDELARLFERVEPLSGNHHVNAH